MRPRRLAGAAAIGALLLGGCATTTVDTAASTTAGSPADATPATLGPVTGTRDELAAALVKEARGLSHRIVEGDGERDSLARLEAVWLALEPEIRASDPDLVGPFEVAIDLAARGVTRRRPADADKASNNLAALVEALEPS